MQIPFRLIFEIFAWLVLAAILVIGVPLFICMPLWVDATYHDLSARNILWGGIHYRDIFETNLPGMVWLHAVVRSVVGWSSEALRIVDLFVVGASITLLGIWVRRIGISRTGQAWFSIAAVLFYVFETEFIHCQRDSWMLLPTVVAMFLRREQLKQSPSSGLGAIYRRGFLEGMLWACAVWIKPHALVPALYMWLASVSRLRATRRAAPLDLLGLLGGGAIVGAIGSAWLIATGTWPWMWDVLLHWNGEYYNWTRNELGHRLSMVLVYFAPWSGVHVVALPVGLAALIRARVWRATHFQGMKPYRMDQALIAALYFGWFAEAVFLQKVFHYSQAPVHILAFAVLASHAWPVGQIFLGWCLLGGAVNEYREQSESINNCLTQIEKTKPHTLKQLVPEHRLFKLDWQPLWLECVTEGSSPQLKDKLSFYQGIHCQPTWAELDEVRHFLETLKLKDGELVCWDDSTHPLYLHLGIKPGIRFMHVNTSLEFRSKRPVIRDELIASGHKYVVSDTAVTRFLYSGYSLETDEDRPLDLPTDFPCFCQGVYPWNQPIIKKIGRYFVHRIENPIDDIRVPYPVRFDKP